jgi:hypothetical protein
MKLSTTDLPKIRFSLIAALLMVTLGIIALLYAQERAKAAQIAQTNTERTYKEFDSKLRQVRNEEKDIRQKTATFSQLQARGIFGDEQRLEWIELLKNIHEQRRLIEMDYEIAAQHPLTALDTRPGNDLAFYASTMKLHVKLLHEEDLTRLLADLRRQAKALIQVKSCKVNRLTNQAAEDASHRAYLLAECEIDWITLHGVAKR